MSGKSLAADATLETVWGSLREPDNFIAGVMMSMSRLRSRGEDVVVRIGITGTGYQPNYRVEDDRREEPNVAYNGANHQPFPDDEQLPTHQTWSSRTMGYGQLAQLRKDRRG